MTGPEDITKVIDLPRGVRTEHGDSEHVEREGARIKLRLRDMDPDRERLFRINAGRGWVSNYIRRQGDFTILKNARPLQAGPDGWFDVCGWTSVKITPEMVGTTVAVFTGEEFKRGPSDKPNDRQRVLGETLERMGGIYRVVRP
jgi:hypothetical protein